MTIKIRIENKNENKIKGKSKNENKNENMKIIKPPLKFGLSDLLLSLAKPSWDKDD